MRCQAGVWIALSFTATTGPSDVAQVWNGTNWTAETFPRGLLSHARASTGSTSWLWDQNGILRKEAAWSGVRGRSTVVFVMRALLLSVVLISSVVLAQSVPGTWSGYVNGWVSEPRPARPVALDPGPVRQPRLTAQQQQLVVLSQLAAQQAYVTQMTMVERQKENARAHLLTPC